MGRLHDGRSLGVLPQKDGSTNGNAKDNGPRSNQALPYESSSQEIDAEQIHRYIACRPVKLKGANANERKKRPKPFTFQVLRAQTLNKCKYAKTHRQCGSHEEKVMQSVLILNLERIYLCKRRRIQRYAKRSNSQIVGLPRQLGGNNRPSVRRVCVFKNYRDRSGVGILFCKTLKREDVPAYCFDSRRAFAWQEGCGLRDSTS